jgi:hypothetical protein
LNRISAEVVIGSEKVKFTNGNEVLLGSDEDAVSGTNVVFTGNLGALTGITIQVAAVDSDVDTILPGFAFMDPVFKNFKFDFAGLSVGEADREAISVTSSGDDKMNVKFTDHDGNEKTVNWAYNNSVLMRLADSSGDLIKVVENVVVNKTFFTVVGNEDEAHLIEVSTITNGSSGYSSDAVTVKDVFSGDTYSVTILQKELVG